MTIETTYNIGDLIVAGGGRIQNSCRASVRIKGQTHRALLSRK